MVVERQPLSSESSSPEHQCQNGSVKRVRAAPAIYRPPAARKLEALGTQIKQNPSVISTVTSTPVSRVSSKSERTRSGTRQRRPDLQVYVPRAKRASMVDRNVTEQQTEHNEIPVNRQVLCGIKKNAPELPSKFQNMSVRADFDEPCHILDPPQVTEDKGQISKKIEIDDFVMEEDNGSLLVEDCAANETIEKCNSETHEIYRNIDSDKVSSSGCESEDFHGSFSSRESTNCESEVLFVSPLSDLNVNLCVSDLCYETSNNCENRAENDSKNNLNIVVISDSKQSDDTENLLNKCSKFVGKKSEHCDEIKDGVGDSFSCVSHLGATVLKQEESNEKNVDSLSKEYVTKKTKRIQQKNVISDVLVISDPESVKQSTVHAKNKNIEKSVTDIQKTKVKHTCETTSGDKSENTTANSTTSLVSLNPDECTWDMLFDDNGDCLDPKIMEELTSAVGSVTIETPQSNYNRFISKPEINLPGGDDEFAHVVEIYNFPSEFKTQDLLSVFSPFKNGGFEIKWVDDTHALGIFSSPRVAADVLAYDHPFVKARALSEATPESRMKARRSAEFLQPYRARPETCVAMARRLVTGALGMRISTSREEREAERRVLKEAREKRRLAAQQQQDAWEGTIR